MFSEESTLPWFVSLTTSKEWTAFSQGWQYWKETNKMHFQSQLTTMDRNNMHVTQSWSGNASFKHLFPVPFGLHKTSRVRFNSVLTSGSSIVDTVHTGQGEATLRQVRLWFLTALWKHSKEPQLLVFHSENMAGLRWDQLGANGNHMRF